MKWMKRLLALAFVACLMTTLPACKEEAKETAPEATPATEPLTESETQPN